MIRSNISRLNSLKVFETLTPSFCHTSRLFSKRNGSDSMHLSEEQAPYYTAKDIEFCPNRAKEVMQNYVEETSQNASNDESVAEVKKMDATTFQSDKDHMDIYQSGNSVSLYSVMQSNVPEPFTTKDKAPTHLNMPGSSSSQNCKYLSEKIQSTHQSKQ